MAAASGSPPHQQQQPSRQQQQDLLQDQRGSELTLGHVIAKVRGCKKCLCCSMCAHVGLGGAHCACQGAPCETHLPFADALAETCSWVLRNWWA
eukprot:scaffold47204_cov20-Tisochrysis_lutea.AAC.2